jgi:hypothetical protein
MFIIYRPLDQIVIGPFETKEDAYTWADHEWGELNADEFYVRTCTAKYIKQLANKESES